MEFLTGERAAELADISYETLLEHIEQGKVIATKDQNGKYQLDNAEVRNLFSLYAPVEVPSASMWESWTVEEAAKFVSISNDAVLNYIKQGIVSATRDNTGEYRLDNQGVRKLVCMYEPTYLSFPDEFWGYVNAERAAELAGIKYETVLDSIKKGKISAKYGSNGDCQLSINDVRKTFGIYIPAGNFYVLPGRYPEPVAAEQAAKLADITYETLLDHISLGKVFATRDHSGHHQFNRADLLRSYGMYIPVTDEVLMPGDVAWYDEKPLSADITAGDNKPLPVETVTEKDRPFKDTGILDESSWDVVIFRDGQPTRSKLRKQFDSHGPLVIGEYRLDRLVSAEILRDASTTTTKSNSLGGTSTDTSNMASRAIVGGLIAGTAGAIIGGGTAKTSTSTHTVSTQSINVDIYMSLSFVDETAPIVIELFSEQAFQEILSSVGQKEWSIDAYNKAADDSKLWLKEKELRTAEANVRGKSFKRNFYLILLITSSMMIYYAQGFWSVVWRALASLCMAGIATVIVREYGIDFFDLRENGLVKKITGQRK